VISQGAQRGLLLPQVPAEHGWDRETFLQQTCLKAGLSRDAWRTGAHIEAFAAEVFGDLDYESG
jgi:AMMECR1 domain-containing protein